MRSLALDLETSQRVAAHPQLSGLLWRSVPSIGVYLPNSFEEVVEIGKQVFRIPSKSGIIAKGRNFAAQGSLFSPAACNFRNGRFRNYTTAEGLSSDHVLSVYQDRRGRVWAGTSAGLDLLAGDHFAAVSATPGLSGAAVNSLAEDGSGDLYALSETDGIGKIEGNRLVDLNAGLDVLGMAESKEGFFWLTGPNGIFRVPAAGLKRWERARDTPLGYATFGRADGLKSAECSVGAPDIVITPDGRLWVATVQGLAMMDLTRMPRMNPKPEVFMEEVVVGRDREHAGDELVLRPGTHHVQLRFNAVDLASPEKVRLQYRLDGVDAAWLDADSTRTAVYTDIPVGMHSFHIRACSSDGVWDRAGIIYRITQQPFFYQTVWFRLVALAAIGLILAALYYLRLRQLAVQIQNRLEERLGERERIARELHDTLLQSVQGLTLRFQAVAERIPESEPARQMMEKALDRADQVLAEGRDRVKSLRTGMKRVSDLPQTLAEAAQELAQGTGLEFSVVVEGEPQPLHPIVQDEAYWIGREALVNAFQHSHGRRIEIEIAYGRRELRLRFRDDGRGIDPEVLQAGGRPGHWGVPGMRERGRKIGGQVSAWSRPGAGTEVELRVPATMAYRTRAGQALWQWFAGRGVLSDGDH
jgi:signal transduction histidine kinase